MPNSGTGASWDETDPANGALVSDGAKQIRDLRIGVELRVNKEHADPVAGTVTSGGLGATGGGEHLQGSAVAFYGLASAPPVNRPDGSAALTNTNDQGRLWMVSDLAVLRLWQGTSWNVLNCEGTLSPLSITGTMIQQQVITGAFHYNNTPATLGHITPFSIEGASAGIYSNINTLTVLGSNIGTLTLTGAVGGTNSSNMALGTIVGSAVGVQGGTCSNIVANSIGPNDLAAGVTLVKSGSYVGNGNSTGPTITLTFQPTWIFIQRVTGGGVSVGAVTSIYLGGGSVLTSALTITSTSFQIKTSNAAVNANTETYLYLAVGY